MDVAQLFLPFDARLVIREAILVEELGDLLAQETLLVVGRRVEGNLQKNQCKIDASQPTARGKYWLRTHKHEAETFRYVGGAKVTVHTKAMNDMRRREH